MPFSKARPHRKKGVCKRKVDRDGGRRKKKAGLAVASGHAPQGGKRYWPEE